MARPTLGDQLPLQRCRDHGRPTTPSTRTASRRWPISMGVRSPSWRQTRSHLGLVVLATSTPSLWGRGAQQLRGASPRCSSTTSPDSSRRARSSRSSLLPTSTLQAVRRQQLGPDHVGLGIRQPHLRVPSGAAMGRDCASGTSHAGRRRQPIPRLCCLSGRRASRDREGPGAASPLSPAMPTVSDVERLPRTLHDAVDALASGTVAAPRRSVTRSSITTSTTHVPSSASTTAWSPSTSAAGLYERRMRLQVISPATAQPVAELGPG